MNDFFPGQPSSVYVNHTIIIVLFMQVEQLDERMIFFLASLRVSAYNIVSKIFESYSEGKLKDQNIPRSKKGIKSIPDLKGSTFKPFRGLDSETFISIMTDIKDLNSSIKEATVRCNDVKKLQKIQQSFMRVVNVASWNEATELYPRHCTPEKLEPFKRLDFSGLKLPEQFIQFCKSAKSSLTDALSQSNDDDAFIIKSGSNVGLIWKVDIMDSTVDSVNEAIHDAQMNSFMGFSLAFMDYTWEDDSEKVFCTSL